ncbi:fungal-specific transcription factor domain-containing protein [Aspergillus pseudotamarii]|uniref:Fungal-specific transcription factor domain-containing protein n=1 Tax=Aspergillus pseudotamarii TaxID=132259 RepID=A0A5N6TC57_ASPPS|nr:fungal-specific transcription factor domain-containing protein [Aspergillus pseudotamarii]KAE8143857.1 fungal-specific transcription factor domain-containing protein [Aspergillus pseudotamarii]
MTTLTDEQSAQSHPTRTRSFGGCTTCRSRHVKCDEGRPACAMCRYFGFVCAGYEKGIFFDFENSTDERRFRRPLLTEAERERMSQWLVSSVPPESALQLLTRIDDLCEKAAPCRDLQVDCGPFGAFRLSQLPSAPSPDVVPEESSVPSTSSPPEDVVRFDDDFTVPSDPPLTPRTQRIIESIFGQSEQAPSTTSPDGGDMEMDHCRIEAVLNDAPLSSFQDFPMTSMTEEQQFPQYPQSADLTQIPPPNPSFSLTTTSKAVPQDVMLLLKHYTTTVISLMTPVRHAKTPWHILFIPHAKTCLAALTLGEDLDNASLTAFYGTLAISAFSLGGLSQSQMWLVQGDAYRQQALKHARLMLRTAYDVPKVAKYKSMMIALLTIVYVSMFSVDRDQTEYFFLETERLIRLRGLKRKKSRKVRLLHHCYAFERFFYESTFTGGMNSRQRHYFRRSIESSGLAQYSRDDLSFRLRGWENLDQEMMEVKSQEDGENDLHLERPGIFSATLYPEIFGVPEPWVLLLSLVIRLGREKDIAESHDLPNPLTLKDFSSRAKAIERRINNLERPSQAQFDEHLNNMLDAMYHALSIYFYRRVYDMEASMLQQKVIAVRDCLWRCADPTVLHVSAGFMWAAFIAACEADDGELQKSFSKWFKDSAQRSGLSSFRETLAKIERIWRERCCGNGISATWLNSMRMDAPFTVG